MKFKPSEKIELDLRGDFTSLDDLNKLRLKLARRANSRLLRLEKKGLVGWAYKPAVRYTRQAYGSNRFSTRKEISDNPFEVIEEVEEIINFLNAESSTVTGVRNIESRITETFRKKGFDIKNPKDFFDFLSSETYKQSEKNLSSEQIQELFDRAIGAGKTATEIKQTLEDFNNKKINTIDELYEDVGLDFWEYVKED